MAIEANTAFEEHYFEIILLHLFDIENKMFSVFWFFEFINSSAYLCLTFRIRCYFSDIFLLPSLLDSSVEFTDEVHWK